jgi:mannosyltransferase OCH1-like enzyme
VNKVAAPTEVFGRPLLHVANRADVLRLRALLDHGGIYLDADVFVHRDFDDLLGHSAVMGLEGQGEREEGLCNAVILAEPGAPFLTRWFEEYRHFRSRGRDEFWNEHSVKLPLRLMREHPE